MHSLILAGILHRDNSFGNLLMRLCGGRMRGFVIDLGLAVLIGDNELATSARHHHLTVRPSLTYSVMHANVNPLAL